MSKKATSCQTRFTFCNARTLEDMQACVLYKPYKSSFVRGTTPEEDRCIFADEFFGMCDGLCYCKHPYIEASGAQEVAPERPPRDENGNRYVNGRVFTPQEWKAFKASNGAFQDSDSSEQVIATKTATPIPMIPSVQDQVNAVDQNARARHARKVLANFGIVEGAPGVKFVAQSGTWILRLRSWKGAPPVDFYSTKYKWRNASTRKLYYGTPEDLIRYLKNGGKGFEKQASH